MPDAAWDTVQEIAHRHGVLVAVLLNAKAGEANSARLEAVYCLGTAYPRTEVATWFGLTVSGVYNNVSRYRSRHGLAAPKGKPEGSGRKRAAPSPAKAGRGGAGGARLSKPLDQVQKIVALGLYGREMGLSYEEMIPYCGVASATICKYLNLWRGGQLGVVPEVETLGLGAICADMAALAHAKLGRGKQAPEPLNDKGGQTLHQAGDKRFIAAMMDLGGYPGRKADTDLGTIHEALIATRKIEDRARGGVRV